MQKTVNKTKLFPSCLKSSLFYSLHPCLHFPFLPPLCLSSLSPSDCFLSTLLHMCSFLQAFPSFIKFPPSLPLYFLSSASPSFTSLSPTCPFHLPSLLHFTSSFLPSFFMSLPPPPSSFTSNPLPLPSYYRSLSFLPFPLPHFFPFFFSFIHKLS